MVAARGTVRPFGHFTVLNPRWLERAIGHHIHFILAALYFMQFTQTPPTAKTTECHQWLGVISWDTLASVPMLPHMCAQVFFLHHIAANGALHRWSGIGGELLVRHNGYGDICIG